MIKYMFASVVTYDPRRYVFSLNDIRSTVFLKHPSLCSLHISQTMCTCISALEVNPQPAAVAKKKASKAAKAKEKAARKKANKKKAALAKAAAVKAACHLPVYYCTLALSSPHGSTKEIHNMFAYRI